MTCTDIWGLRWTQFYFTIWLWAMAWEQRNGPRLKKRETLNVILPRFKKEMDPAGVEMMCLVQWEKLRCVLSSFRKMSLGQQDPGTSRWDNSGVGGRRELRLPRPPRWLQPRTQLVFPEMQKRVPALELRGSLPGSLSFSPLPVWICMVPPKVVTSPSLRRPSCLHVGKRLMGVLEGTVQWTDAEVLRRCWDHTRTEL